MIRTIMSWMSQKQLTCPGIRVHRGMMTTVSLSKSSYPHRREGHIKIKLKSVAPRPEPWDAPQAVEFWQLAFGSVILKCHKTKLSGVNSFHEKVMRCQKYVDLNRITI